MSQSSDGFSDLAEAVAEGAAIDWDAVESNAEPADLAMVRALRDVESVVGAHRRVLESAASGRRHRPLRLGVGDTWSHLEIRRYLGGGGFGDVYEAFDPKVERQTALKLLAAPDADDEAMLQEARLLAKVSHQNVVRVYGADQLDGQVGISMELLRGHTLTAELDQFGPMGADDAVVIGMRLCDALAEVHRQAIVHRDVKAQNVMREPGGRIVLMDFGIGLDEDSGRGVGPAGTPAYLAPELLVGGKASATTDIYALGVLLFHLVTADFPVRGQSMAEFCSRHEAGEVQHLPDLRSDLPEAFVQVVEKALAAKPEQRFQSAGAFHRALSRAMASSVLGDGRQAASTRSTRSGRLPAAALLGLGLLVGLGVWRVAMGPEAIPPPEIRVLLDRIDDRTRDVAFSGSTDSALRSAVRASSVFEPVPQAEERQVSLQMVRVDPSASFAESELRDAASRSRAPVILGGSLTPVGQGWELHLWLAATLDPGAQRSTQRPLPRLTMAAIQSAVEEALAELELLSRDWRRSESFLESVPDLEVATTNSPEALRWYTEGLRFYREGEISASESRFRSAVQLDPDFALGHLHLGHSIAAQGNPEGALQQFKASFDRRGRTATDLERLTIDGAFYAAVRQYRHAIESYEQVLDIVDDDPSTFRQLALAHLALGRLDEAIQNARRGRGDSINHGLLVYILATAGQPEQALEEAEGIRSRYGVTPYLEWSEALALLGLERIDEAMERTRTLAAGATGVYRNLASWLEARIHLFSGDLTAAAEVLYKDRRTDAVEGAGFLEVRRRCWTARCQAIRGQSTNALGVLDSLDLAAIPAHLQGWRSVAVLRAELGDVAGAEVILRRMEEVDSQYPSLISEMVTAQIRAELLLAQGSPRAAVEALRTGDAQADVSFVRTAARARAAMGDYEESVFLDERLIERKGEILDQAFVGFLVESHVRRARCLELLGREAEADEAWRMARRHWGSLADKAFGPGAPADALPWIADKAVDD